MNRLLALFGLCLFLSACASERAVPNAPPHAFKKESATGAGFSAAELRTAFGAPAFTRKENGAEMWRYDGTDCRAFFFLYPEDTAQVVRHVETVPQTGRSADENCLKALRRRS